MLKKLFITSIVLLPISFSSNSQIQFPTPEGFTTNTDEAMIETFRCLSKPCKTPPGNEGVNFLCSTLDLHLNYSIQHSTAIEGKTYSLLPAITAENSILSFSIPSDKAIIEVSCAFAWFMENSETPHQTSPTYYLKELL